MDTINEALQKVFAGQCCGWNNVLDILIVAVFIYYVLVLIRGTRAVQLLLGVLVIVGIYGLAVLLKLELTKFVLSAVFAFAVFALLIVFQPELRRALGQLGQLGPLNRLLVQQPNEEVDHVVDELVRAALLIAEARHGALIVVERSTGLQDYSETGVPVHGKAHRRAARVDLHDALAAARRRGDRSRRSDPRGRVPAPARGDAGARGASLWHASPRGAVGELADGRGRGRRLRGDAGDLDRLQRPHDRRPRRGAPAPGAVVAAPQPHPAAALPQQGVLAVRAVEGVRPAWLRRRIDVRRIVTHDFPLKAVAVVIALLFWVGIMQNAAPSVITVAFDGRIPVERPDNVPSGYVLRGALGDVVVTLRGAPGVADRVALSELRATLDVNALALGQAEPQDARRHGHAPPKDGVEVVDVSPPTVSVRVERLTSRTLLVQPRFSNEPPAGTRAGEAAVAPTEVRVTGPESDVARIAAVLGTVRFGDGQTDIESPGTPAIPVDAAGVPIDGLEVEPGGGHGEGAGAADGDDADRAGRVHAARRGRAGLLGRRRGDGSLRGDGARRGGGARRPSIASRRSRSTSAISSATRTLTVGLAVPAGVTLLRPTDITVTVTVQALAGTRVFSSAIVVTGLARESHRRARRR